MRDFVEYLRAYRAYVSANLGWGKALRFALVWLAGMFAPLVMPSARSGREDREAPVGGFAKNNIKPLSGFDDMLNGTILVI
jgi:hypothetical protein